MIVISVCIPIGYFNLCGGPSGSPWVQKTEVHNHEKINPIDQRAFGNDPVLELHKRGRLCRIRRLLQSCRHECAGSPVYQRVPVRLDASRPCRRAAGTAGECANKKHGEKHGDKNRNCSLRPLWPMNVFIRIHAIPLVLACVRCY